MNLDRNSQKTARLAMGALLISLLCAGYSHAVLVDVKVENTAPAGGLFLTPVWAGFHDGSFDLFDVGQPASAALESIAEDGMTDLLRDAFNGHIDGVIAPGSPFGPQGSAFLSSASASFDLTAGPLYFSYASMVIPSNDAFIGNGNATAYQVTNDSGQFIGPLTIELFGADVWDAGTEVNNAMGAAFSGLGGKASDEGGTVGPHAGLDNFLGSGFAPPPVDKEALATAFAADTPVARITITPEPSSALICLAGLVGLFCRRR